MKYRAIIKIKILNPLITVKMLKNFIQKLLGNKAFIGYTKNDKPLLSDTPLELFQLPHSLS